MVLLLAGVLTPRGLSLLAKDRFLRRTLRMYPFEVDDRGGGVDRPLARSLEHVERDVGPRCLSRLFLTLLRE